MARHIPVDEFLAGIDDFERYGLCEYWNGQVVPKHDVAPPRAHAALKSALLWILESHLRGDETAEVLPSLHCCFPTGDVLLPDICVVGIESTDDPWAPQTRAPELAVEILLPSDRIANVTRKVDFYLRNGVKVVWLIHMQSREATIHTAHEEVRLIPESGSLTAEAVLPGLAIPLAAVLPRGL